jgi:succinate dehydrogenase/fumarate reductase flavoprotein subunit
MSGQNIWDAIVIGSGAAGLTAAITAAQNGLSVLVVEKTSWFGGTTALSGGGIWIPANPHAAAAGISDSTQAARAYIAALVGNKLHADMLDSYLQAGPEMLNFLEAKSEVRFAIAPHSPDWHQNLPGAAPDGRLLRPLEYDAKKLNGLFAQIRPPRATFNAPGGFMIDLPDLPHLTNATASFKSFRYMARLAARFGWDRLRGHPRGTRLTMGNALVARLLKSAQNAGVTLWRNTNVTALLTGPNGVSGIQIERNGLAETLIARQGVVLATGGFSANPQLSKTYMPYPDQHISITADSATGDGIALGLEAGGSLDDENHANGVWSVASTLAKPDGTTALYAHLIDMAKPGCIAVGKSGTRFGNEAAQEFVPVMHDSGNVPAWLIADARFIKAYGLGMVLPGGIGLKNLLKAGYINQAPTLEALAAKLGINPANLAATAARMNGYAQTGKDPEFQKGDIALDREMGDPKHQPNPCLGPIQTPPFYAVQINPGDGSTTIGLRINPKAQVLTPENHPIPNLYAAGLDANSLWRGKAPAHGCNIGPAMVMGYIAGRSLSGGK